MVSELMIRFLVGGVIVAAFAVVGDVLRPKSFSGIFGAAPSVALASLGLAFFSHGGEYASIEARSMVAGAMALLAYSWLLGRVLIERRASALAASGTAWVAWLAVAFSLWWLFLR